jgi:hypothetical protein
MLEDIREAESSLFEVVLYIENKSWAFSTCAYSTHLEAALELAEKDFSVHALHHKLGNIKAECACVLDSTDDHYFTKRNGRWQIETDRFGPFSAAPFSGAAKGHQTALSRFA